MKGLKDAFWLFVGSVMLCLLFDTINPPGWPKWAIPAELAGVMLFFAMCKGAAKMADQEREDKKEREQQERENGQIAKAVQATLQKIADVNPDALRNIDSVTIRRVEKEEADGEPTAAN